MSTASRSCTIARTPAEVWDVLTDARLIPRWQHHIVEARLEPPGEAREGARLIQVRRFLGRHIELVVTATRVERPRRIDVAGSYGPVDFSGGYALAAVARGCVVDFRIDLELPRLLARFTDVVVREIAGQAEGDLARLRTLCEGTPTGPTAGVV